MPRFCAASAEMGSNDIRAQLDSMGAQVVGDVGRCGFGIIDHPGVAGEPVAVGGLTAVGEVTLFNADTLRRKLNDPEPPARSDLELLVRIYRRFGPAGIADADGMFAMAIHDGDDLMLVRDHVGARTLFYARAQRIWATSTSLRALGRWPALASGLNLPAVESFLAFAYLPGEQTLFRGISEVLPGRCVRLRANGDIESETYWEPTDAAAPRRREDDDETDLDVAELRALLEQATARRLPPGERVGVLLSGGVDSSLVTALAAKLHDQRVMAYSIGFDGSTPDELAYSGLVAAHCNVEHRVLTVSGAAVAARLSETVALLDCPVGDPLTVPNLMLAEAAAADGHRVILNGEGGDPIFGGPKNLPMLIFELSRTDPSPTARAAAYLASYRKCHEDLPALLRPDVLGELSGKPPLTDLLTPYLQPGQMHYLLNKLCTPT